MLQKDKEKTFEEYKMELVLLSDDIILTSTQADSGGTVGGEGQDGGSEWD